jgi:AraC-like DNA-binding protein
MVRYSTLVSEQVLLELEPTRGTLRLHHSVPGEHEGFGVQVNEFFLSFCVNVTRQLAGADFKPLGAWLAHPTTDVREVERYVGCAVTAGAGRNGLAYSRADLTRPVKSADPALLSVLDQHAAQVASARPRMTGLMPQVRELLREALPQGGSVIERVASRMHMSSRTLQRRLADEGASFQVLLEQLRQELAVQLVTERQRSLGEIAFMLGYSDLRTFARAYRRWTGTTPGAARDAAPRST